MTTTVRRVVGTMTGTSIDAIDAAVMHIEGEGLELRASLVASLAHPLGPIEATLRAAAQQKSMTSRDFAELAWGLGEVVADAVRLLCDRCALSRPDLIVVHGQTVVHLPPISWQLVNPFPIAARLGCRVVHDLRQADLAAGGQGAPITPLADWVLFRHDQRRRAIVNLGGFCNISVLPAGDGAAKIDQIAGFDVCACNQVLDAVARAVLDSPFDANGTAALRGKADPSASSQLGDLLFDQRKAARSLGTGDEAAEWVDRHRAAIAPHDLAATAVDAIATTIANALRSHEVDEVLLAGGGARNAALADRLESLVSDYGVRDGVRSTDAYGIPITVREAAAMAVLGALAEDGVPITLPQVTGRNAAGRDGSRTDGR